MNCTTKTVLCSLIFKSSVNGVGVFGFDKRSFDKSFNLASVTTVVKTINLRAKFCKKMFKTVQN